MICLFLSLTTCANVFLDGSPSLGWVASCDTFYISSLFPCCISDTVRRALSNWYCRPLILWSISSTSTSPNWTSDISTPWIGEDSIGNILAKSLFLSPLAAFYTLGEKWSFLALLLSTNFLLFKGFFIELALIGEDSFIATNGVFFLFAWLSEGSVIHPEGIKNSCHDCSFFSSCFVTNNLINEKWNKLGSIGLPLAWTLLAIF